MRRAISRATPLHPARGALTAGIQLAREVQSNENIHVYDEVVKPHFQASSEPHHFVALPDSTAFETWQVYL